jgi:adenylate cyclase class IV
MWINNKTVEWLDSMDLQDKNAKITQKIFQNDIYFICNCVNAVNRDDM